MSESDTPAGTASDDPAPSEAAQIVAGIPLTVWAGIPPHIRKRIEGDLPAIARNGTLGVRTERSTKCNLACRLRYRVFDENLGCTVQRTISLGRNPILYMNMQALMEHFQAARQIMRDQAVLKRNEEAQARQEYRRDRRLAQIATGGNRSLRARAGREFDEVMASNDIRLQVTYGMILSAIRHRTRRRGRPRKLAALLTPQDSPLATAKKVLKKIQTELGCGPQGRARG